jgi:hypothetical protein
VPPVGHCTVEYTEETQSGNIRDTVAWVNSCSASFPCDALFHDRTPRLTDRLNR